MHFGLDSQQAVGEFARILRYGLVPRQEQDQPSQTS
jgi:hypothetical protein